MLEETLPDYARFDQMGEKSFVSQSLVSVRTMRSSVQYPQYLHQVRKA
jgi:hypothetical protein